MHIHHLFRLSTYTSYPSDMAIAQECRCLELLQPFKTFPTFSSFPFLLWLDGQLSRYLPTSNRSSRITIYTSWTLHYHNVKSPIYLPCRSKKIFLLSNPIRMDLMIFKLFPLAELNWDLDIFTCHLFHFEVVAPYCSSSWKSLKSRSFPNSEVMLLRLRTSNTNIWTLLVDVRMW